MARVATSRTLRRDQIPSAFSGLVLWLDAAAGPHVQNGAVDIWQDLSGTGNHFVQATPAARPTVAYADVNGRDALLFDGVNDTLTCSATFARYHAFAVVKQVVNQQQPYFASGDGTNANTIGFISGHTKLRVDVSASSTGFGQTGSDTADTSYHTMSINGFAASNSANCIYRDGTLSDSGSDGAGGYGGSGVTAVGSNGAAAFGNVKIAELILYSAALSTAQRQLVEAYLRTKYATW